MGCPIGKPVSFLDLDNNELAFQFYSKPVGEGGFDHSALIIDNPGNIDHFYKVEKTKIGEGAFGAVRRAISTHTGVERAVKSMPKAQMMHLDRFRLEIAIMKTMDHPNIIKLFESFEDARYIYLVLELCSGGDLFDRIIDAGHFTESQAATVMQHLFRALFYMHQNHIAHRDLKPENFLFMTKDPIEHSCLKVIDFGLACQFRSEQMLRTRAGTPFYVAPEVLNGAYNELADTWSLGAIMYVLLSGYPPFSGDNDEEILNKVKNGGFTFPPKEWNLISSDAKSLITELLKMDPSERFTARQALNHVWIRDQAPQASNTPIEQGLLSNLKDFRNQNKLKKAALHVIASHLGETDVSALRDAFVALDDNGDGLLTAAELRDGLAKVGLQELLPDLEKIAAGIDSDGSGMIDYTEFLAATIDKRNYANEDVCWQAFRVFDRDGNGTISKEELAEVLSDGEVQRITASQQIEVIMRDIDANGDGEIDFDEFMQMMRGGVFGEGL